MERRNLRVIMFSSAAAAGSIAASDASVSFVEKRSQVNFEILQGKERVGREGIANRTRNAFI